MKMRKSENNAFGKHRLDTQAGVGAPTYRRKAKANVIEERRICSGHEKAVTQPTPSSSSTTKK